MASRKRETYQIEPRIYVPFILELDDESKIKKKLFVIKEIGLCSRLPAERLVTELKKILFLKRNNLRRKAGFMKK